MLVLGAINAIENYSNPLCIRLSLPREQYKEAYRELLYLIMKGLPLHLRIKISAFSYARAGAAIYVSDHTEGNNYFDLDTREAVIDTSRMSQLGFTRIYNTLPAKAEAQRDLMLQAMADFINTAFENPLKDAGCALVEAGFQEKVKKNDEEVIAAAKAAHAHGFIKRLPQGYATVMAEDGGNLSQGQKQLLCNTRVMLCLPPMLILDEATSSIDTRTEIKIQKAFAKLMKGRTSFIVAHRLSTIQEADIILVMKDGHIIEQGRHEELLAQKGFYANLYESQIVNTSSQA